MSFSRPAEQLPRLRLRVSPVAESILRGGHPWLFSDSIREQNREGSAGELAVVYDRQDKFLAVGLFDPQSPLRLRVLHAGKPRQLDPEWWVSHFQAAVQRRAGLFGDQTTGYRLINGESDGWPGLVLDRYGPTHVLKLYTIAWMPHLDLLRGLLTNSLQATHVVLRLSRNIRAAALEQFTLSDGQTLIGSASTEATLFLESGLRFEADVYRGQKTGFFLDQRENRRCVEGFARGMDVLNAFSYSGGFSVYAARGGARSVTEIDISPHALEAAQRNFGLNVEDPQVARCQRVAIKADAFDWFREQLQHKFHVIVLDPPSLAKRADEKGAAIEAYVRLVERAVSALHPQGLLVAASCSAHVSAEEFFQAVQEGMHLSGRKSEELQRTGHPVDHPATFREAQYLKCVYVRVT